MIINFTNDDHICINEIETISISIDGTWDQELIIYLSSSWDEHYIINSTKQLT